MKSAFRILYENVELAFRCFAVTFDLFVARWRETKYDFERLDQPAVIVNLERSQFLFDDYFRIL